MPKKLKYLIFQLNLTFVLYTERKKSMTLILKEKFGTGLKLSDSDPTLRKNQGPDPSQPRPIHTVRAKYKRLTQWLLNQMVPQHRLRTGKMYSSFGLD